MPLKVYNPKPKKQLRRMAVKKVVTVFIILVLISAVIFSGWFVLSIFNPVNLSITNFKISQGEGVNQISRKLKRKGIIRTSFVFESYVYLKDLESDFKAGEYNLPRVLNINRLTQILTQGQPTEEWKITIPEGFTTKDIALRLENIGKFQADKFLQAVGVGQGEYDVGLDISAYNFLQDLPDNTSLEGYLFPDTYRFFPYATVDDVIRKMLNNFDHKLTVQMRQDIQAQHKTIFEIITLASIIEREVKTDQDRAIVAGIFNKRLKADMPLQADSTINYVTGKNTPAVSGVDLKIDSLYNTYKYKGLPPGPISNPGIESIKAAIYPEDSNYWYFLTDKQGNAHYAEDFEEHKQNKAKYLR